MQLGEHTNDYTELVASDKLTLLHLRLQQLVEQVEKIQKEQEYQRVRGWAGPSWDSRRVPCQGVALSAFPLEVSSVLATCLRPSPLPTVARGALPEDQREYQPEGAVVGHPADPHLRGHQHLADAAPQELL